jgi:hypothetical protein
MKHVLRLLLVLVALVLGTGIAAMISASRSNQARAHTVAEVLANLARSPDTWVGRTVRVRAVVASRCAAWLGGPAPVCATWQPALVDPAAAGADPPLPIQPMAQPPLLGGLRRLPFAGRLVPAPQHLHWGMPATYRVLLSIAPSSRCDRGPCYEALLLDAAP